MERRKVVIRKLSGEILKGYMEKTVELRDATHVSLLSLTEDVINVPKGEIKALFFVRKFSGDKQYNDVRFFKSQPKIESLWVRLTFIDSETIEGIVPNSCGLLLEDGFPIMLADPNSNNLFIYVLKAALKDFAVLGMQYSKGDLLGHQKNGHQPKEA